MNEFRMDCRNLLINTVKQLLEKCPLKYSIIRNLPCLNPQTVRDKESSKAKMKRLLQSLIEVNGIDHNTADQVMKE